MEPSPASAHLEQHMAAVARLIPLIHTLWQLLMNTEFSTVSHSPLVSDGFLSLLPHGKLSWSYPSDCCDFISWQTGDYQWQCWHSVPRRDSGSPACGLQVRSPTQGTSRWNSRDFSQHWVLGEMCTSVASSRAPEGATVTNPAPVPVSRVDVLTESREWN